MSADIDLCVSPLVRRFASKIVSASKGAPILDVGCGSGRNAIFLSLRGSDLICMDKNLANLVAGREQIAEPSLRSAAARLSLRHIDLLTDPWPFAANTVGGIISIHFLLPSLFPHFERSLIPGGYLLLQSVPGCGGNYRELPQADEVRTELGRGFELELYRERPVGPSGCGAVTVRAVGTRR